MCYDSGITFKGRFIRRHTSKINGSLDVVPL